MCIRSRGLSVLLRVTSIFTRSAISPSSWLRQWRSRYAIRAGRNLPDKEFRYLRMVIVNSRFSLVSAAVHAQTACVVTIRAPLLPKLRGYFAEFLNHDSLDRLGILYLTT